MTLAQHGFFVDDMTSLRYAIPFIKAARELVGVDVVLFFSDKSDKYNSIRHHRPRFDAVCEENDIDPYNTHDIPALEVDTLVCVENVTGGIAHKRCFSFQHGFDYRTLSKSVSGAVYLVTEDQFSRDLAGVGVPSMIQPIPVVFWDWDFTVSFIEKTELLRDKSATMFYPEVGLHDAFSEVWTTLRKRDWVTYTKQRMKNQLIPNHIDLGFYDKVWYPSESIFLPMCTDVTIGFGTSAYTDIYHIRPFIDFSLPAYSKDYYKPTSTNFKEWPSPFSSALQDFCKGNIPQITKEDKLKNPCDSQQIEDFLRQVFA